MKKLVLVMATALLAVCNVGVAYAPEASAPTQTLLGQTALELACELGDVVNSSDRQALEGLKEELCAVDTVNFTPAQMKVWGEITWQVEMLGLKGLDFDLVVAEQVPVRLVANFWLEPLCQNAAKYRLSELARFQLVMMTGGIEDVAKALGLKAKLVGSPWRERASLFLSLLGEEGFQRDQALVCLWDLPFQEGFESLDRALTDFARALYGQSVVGNPPIEVLEGYVRDHLKRCLRAHPDLCPLDGEWEIFEGVITPEDLPPPKKG